MKALKYSRQREAIKACLMSHHDHPTADVLYARIREEFPNISLGTVYRNLNLLTKTGEVRRLAWGDGSDHFDGNTTPHYHFLCTRCKKVYDIPMEPLKELNEAAQDCAPGIITSHSLVFSGECCRCLAEEKISQENHP